MAVLRPAEQNDYSILLSLMNGMNYLHRHLDWRDTLTWLGHQPFWIMEEDNHQVKAALACPAEPAEVAWVRLFAVSNHTSPDRAWQKLFEKCLETWQYSPQPPVIAALALREWFEDLLRRNGFRHHQDIVVFMFDQAPPPPLPHLESGLVMREMRPDDLDQVERIDHRAFEPIWRLSTDDLRFAYQKSSYCTVMELDGQIIAYQMCSSSGMYAHLARLAVLPDLQHRRIGFALVQNLLDHYINHLSFWGVTLNTQHDNNSSLALYHKIGFRLTGERFPVYLYAK